MNNSNFNLFDDSIESDECSIDVNNIPADLNYIVRRLTPMECERLQGFPDNWTNIPGASDSARYKALGNSICLPQWMLLCQRMTEWLPEDATLMSLFDGIAGFPYSWERAFGKGTALYSSEIEPFPLQVITYHFGDKVNGIHGDWNE